MMAVAHGIEYGARLGYALALTQDRLRDGWEAWLRAAHDELARAGCSLALHLEPEHVWQARLRKEFDELQRRGPATKSA
jgi:hypothetical protein